MLARQYKLKKTNEFKKNFKQGKSFEKDFIKIKILENTLSISRFACVVSLKISKKANKRNKIKRQLEEIIRLNLDKIKPGFDIIILAKKEIIEKNYLQTEKALTSLLEQTGILK